MARVLYNLLLFLFRLALKIRVWGYWSLIYGYCALCTIAALLKLWWNIILRPTTTFQWVIRETPPACLNDTSLGTHCYVRIKVRHTNPLSRERLKGKTIARVPAWSLWVWNATTPCMYRDKWARFWSRSRTVRWFLHWKALRWCWKNSSSASRLTTQGFKASCH